MATYYVSNTAVNGYPVGSDANDGLSIANAKLTLNATLTAAPAGSEILLNDGTYSHTSFYNITKAVTINAVNPLAAILQNTSTVRVVNIQASAALSVTFGAVVIDANNLANSGITFSAGSFLNTLTLNGTKLLSAKQNALLGSAIAIALTVSNADITSAYATGSGINLIGIAGSSYAIDGLTFSLPAHTTSLGGGVVLSASAAGVTASVKNVTGTMATTASSGSHLGVRIFNCANALIEDCNITLTGGTSTAAGFPYWIGSDTATPQSSANGTIRNCRGSHQMPAGVLALIGQDSSAATTVKNLSNDGTISGCVMSGTVSNRAALHGYMLGNNTGGLIYNNYADNVAFVCIAKGQTNGVVHHNIGVNLAGTGGIYSKASVNTKFYNNTLNMIGAASSGMYAGYDSVTSVYSTGIEFKNNIVYATGNIANFTNIETGNTATLSNNLYYSTVVMPTEPWVLTGTVYASLAEWQAAKEATAQMSDPLLSAWIPSAASPAKGSGVDVSLTTDYAGRATRVPPTIGAYEWVSSSEGGFHNVRNIQNIARL